MEQQVLGVFAGLQSGQVAILVAASLYGLWAIPTVLSYVGVRNSHHGLSARAVWIHDDARRTTFNVTLMFVIVAGAAATMWLVAA